MGMLELPDTYGIPEYRVKEAYMEIDGHDIRMAFGGKRFGHVEWLYTVVMTPEEVLEMCHKLQVFAADAIGIMRLNGERRELPHHH